MYQIDILTNLNLFLEMQPVLSYAIIIIFSLMIGSFLNVLIYRIPITIFNAWRSECYDYLELKPSANITTKNISILKPCRSFCPNCNQQINLIDNIPLLSYLMLKGKCKSCQKKISLRYPFIEFITMAASILVILEFGFSLLSLSIIFLTYLLILIAAIDFDHLIIPDNLSYIGLWLGLLINTQILGYNGFIDINQAILGCIIGYLVLWSLYWIFKILTGKEGFGHGDFKLTALFGAWLGVYSLFPLLIIASLSGIIVSIIAKIAGKREFDQPFPFGPYLALAGWLMLLYKDYWPLNNLGVIY